MSTKTNITTDTVKHVAKISRLGLSEDEIEKYTTQLSNVLEYVGKLNEINTDDVEPTAQVTGLTNVSRKDEVTQSLSQEEALSSSANSTGRYFKVKATIK